MSGSTEVGIGLASLDWSKPGANYNFVKANSIVKNTKMGIGINNSVSNIIIGNSFLNNGRDGYDGGSNTKWDDGTHGNYWTDYKGKDTNGDGVGDTPYQISPNGVDRYPLMKPPI